MNDSRSQSVREEPIARSVVKHLFGEPFEFDFFQAVRLLAPVAPAVPRREVPPMVVPGPPLRGSAIVPAPAPGWKAAESGESDGLAADDLRRLLAELEQKLGAGRNRRLKINWTLLEEDA